VALNRPSYLSSTFTGLLGAYPANKGNDGDKTNCDAQSLTHSVAHTESESNPWFGVDLGVALYVAGVRLTNREDITGDQGERALCNLLLYHQTKLFSY